MASLRCGDRGPEVKHLQELLNRHLKPSPKLVSDGAFGRKTEAAVRLYQASVGLGIDGVAGPRTFNALEKGLRVLSAPVSIPANFPDAPWMAFAIKEIGQREITGVAHNPRIIAYHASTTFRADADETPWCSSFVNWCLQQAGITGTNSAAAMSWLNWGKATAALSGAITVIYNSKSAGSSLTASGNHVGFMVQDTSTHYRLLGGNQSNQVKISSYPKASWSIKGFRWPKS